VAILIIATALAAVALPQKADAATLKSRLHKAKLALGDAQDRLKAAEGALAAAEAADAGLTSADTTATPTPTPTPTPTCTATTTPVPVGPTVDELKAQVRKARHGVRLWTVRVRRLTSQYRLELQMAKWEKKHQWMPIIKVAAARYHVRADGMYRMMMRESGGQPYAGSASAFKGLYQYYTGTWAASWNPWRSDSIYDGSSQIFATAYAIHRGMGPSMWTTTFASQY